MKKTSVMSQHSLGTRVATLALESGLVALTAAIIIVGSLSTASTTLKVLVIVGVLVALPVLVGWFTSRLVTKPLKNFATAISSLQKNQYKHSLKPSGIAEFDAVFASFNELTKRLHREEELRKDLLSDVSHEFNTPLSAMTAQLVAIQDGKVQLTKERVDVLKQQTDRLIELVNGLDAYTKARIPHNFSPERVSVLEVCEQIVAELQPSLDEESIKAVVDVPADLYIMADRQALCRIVLNLLQNTVRYSEASEVRIATAEHGLTFSDNGRGVPKESVPYLFERFYRVEKSRNKATGGLGLGLAIVKELVERQGWSIHVEAAQPGLKFVITFKS